MNHTARPSEAAKASPGAQLHAIMQVRGMTLSQQKDALEQAFLIVTRLQRKATHARRVDWAEEVVTAVRDLGA